MSSYFATSDRVTNAIDFDFAESVTAVFEPGKPIDVKRIVLVIKELSNGAETITVAVRDAGDAGNSTTIGTFIIPDAAAVNAVYKVDIANVDAAVVVDSAGGISQPVDVTTGRVVGYQTNLPGVIEVNVGQEISFTSTGGTATTGQANLYVEYEEMGNNPDRFDATDITFTNA
jgi:hypothetical protein